MLALATGSSNAALAVGERAPEFTIDAALGGKPFKFALADALTPGTADRVSYVIDRSGRVAYSYSSLNPEWHVANTLKVVEGLVSVAKAPRLYERP